MSHSLFHVKGDATRPPECFKDDIKVIPHVVNTHCCWGAGFVLALSARWKAPEQSYFEQVRYIQSRPYAFKSSNRLPLGLTDVAVINGGKEGIFEVANMVAQEGFMIRGGAIPLRHGALLGCLSYLSTIRYRGPEYAGRKISFHCPKFGAGLAGGKWEDIEPMIRETILDVGDVYIYTP